MLVIRKKKCSCGSELLLTTEYFPLGGENRPCGLCSQCKSCYANRVKVWRLDNAEHCSNYNKNERPKYHRKYTPEQRLIANERSRQSKFLKKQNQNTISLVGLSGAEWMEYLLAKAKPGMTAENYGKVWSVDHIYPLSLAKDEEHLQKLFHYSNTQPLFCEENTSKGNRWIG